MLATIAESLLSPLGIAIALGTSALGALQLATNPRTRKFAISVLLAAFLWLWAWSTPLASGGVRALIERQAGPRAIADVAAAAAIVVLGGGVAGAQAPARPYPDLNSAADRMWHAARLYRAGKAPVIVLSGGALRNEAGTEADAMRTFLLDMGIPSAAIVLEEASDSTAANARRTGDLLRSRDIRTVILVTSALHMARARRAFEQEGLVVIPAPTDFEITDRPFGLRMVLPDAESLSGSGRAMKELTGLALAP